MRIHFFIFMSLKETAFICPYLSNGLKMNRKKYSLGLYNKQ